MMKLARHLFGWSADPRLMDYYERAMFNHRLGTINPEDGTMMYYLPLASGYWKTFGKPFDSLWCCTGTGSEEYGKLTDTIYFHDDDSLYVNLFVDSQLEWPEKGLRVKQETRFPEQDSTSLTLSVKSPVQMTINLRIPYWARGGSVKINGTPLGAFASPSSYLSSTGSGRAGTRSISAFRWTFTFRPCPTIEQIQAMMYGPLVLAGKFEPVTKEMTYSGDYEPKPTDPAKVPDIAADPAHPTGWVEPDAKQPLTFRAVGQTQPLTLVPLYKVIHERYAVYWKVDKKTT